MLAPESTADTPAITSISTSSSPAISYISPASPYTPASPEQTSATLLPPFAISSVSLHLSTSCLIGVFMYSLSGKYSLIISV